MKIEFVGKRISKKLRAEIERAICLVLDELGQKHDNLTLNIMFINEKDMRALNNRTRNIDKVTDVLSYPNFDIKPNELIDTESEGFVINGEIILGDMAICLKQAKRQAKEYKVTLTQEVIKLVIHSTLHLMGYDHIKDEDYEVMQKKEDDLASKFYTNKKI